MTKGSFVNSKALKLGLLILCNWNHLLTISLKWQTLDIQIGPTKTAPLLINTIEMRVLWMEIKYIKSASRLLNRAWVNKGGLDLSKEVLWVSVGQRAAELPAIKVGGQKKILPSGPVRTRFARAGLIGRIFFDLQLWQPVKLMPFNLERPKVPL